MLRKDCGWMNQVICSLAILQKSLNSLKNQISYIKIKNVASIEYLFRKWKVQYLYRFLFSNTYFNTAIKLSKKEQQPNLLIFQKYHMPTEIIISSTEWIADVVLCTHIQKYFKEFVERLNPESKKSKQKSKTTGVPSYIWKESLWTGLEKVIKLLFLL